MPVYYLHPTTSGCRSIWLPSEMYGHSGICGYRCLCPCDAIKFISLAHKCLFAVEWMQFVGYFGFHSACSAEWECIPKFCVYLRECCPKSMYWFSACQHSENIYCQLRGAELSPRMPAKFRSNCSQAAIEAVDEMEWNGTETQDLLWHPPKLRLLESVGIGKSRIINSQQATTALMGS